MRIYFILITVLMLLSVSLQAQTINQNSGWLFLLNNTKFNKNWGAYLDMQLRSADEWGSVRNFLFRPGVTYYLNDQHEFTLGYLLNQTFMKVAGSSDNVLTEHRVWEQYVHKHKLSTISVSHRFRLEQRFIERRANNDLFSQRLRYFIRFILPLQKGKQNFDKGPFAALQNELFFNLQKKKELNNNIFDQNRAYLAAGYRFSKKLDVEAGYLNQSVKGLNNNTMNNVVQLAVYTKF
jgi:hypothetical protein